MISIQLILNDPMASRWLQSALRDALVRDAVDAAIDAEVLAEILILRADRLLAGKPIGDGEQIDLRGGFHKCPECGAGQ